MHPFMLSSLNWWAIFVSAIVFWLFGSLWFSTLGQVWRKEVEKRGVKMKKPSSKEMIFKSILTFILNFIVAFGVAVVIYQTGIMTIRPAISWGLLLGVCISAATIVTAYLWQNRSLKLTIIDIVYPIIGIIISAIIITLWR